MNVKKMEISNDPWQVGKSAHSDTHFHSITGRDTERNAEDVRYACYKARAAIAKAEGKA